MYEANTYGIQRNLSAVLAAAIGATSGLVFDRAHLASAPEGIVEVGQLTPVQAPLQGAAQPEIVITTKRV